MNWPFLDVSNPEKTYCGHRQNVRLTLREINNFSDDSANEKFSFRDTKSEVTILGHFGTWESVFSHPARRPVFRLRNDHFSDVSAPEKFPPDLLNTRDPFAIWPFLDVSKPEKVYYCLRGNGLLNLREMTIFPTFRQVKNIVSRKSKRPVSRSRSDNFWTFWSLKKRILSSGETACLPFAKWTFFSTFRLLKKCYSEIVNRRVPLCEVTIFGRFGAWETLFSPPAKRPAYLSRNDHFFRRFGAWKGFFSKYEKAGFPFSKFSCLDVMETENAYSRLWRKGWLTVCEMTFFRCFGTWESFTPEQRNGWVPETQGPTFGSFGAWESVFSALAKLPAYRSRNDHFSDVSAPLKFPPEILTAGFPFANWPFLDVSVPENRILTSGETAGLPLPKWPLFDFSAPETFPPDIRNAWVPFRIVNIYGRFGAWESVFSPKAKRPAYRSRNDHFPTFRHLK